MNLTGRHALDRPAVANLGIADEAGDFPAR